MPTRLNFAVIGTPNRLEYDQGFFVKNGDGAADVKPIAHLYKSQVYQLARSSRRAGGGSAPARPPPIPGRWHRRRRSSTSPCPTDKMDLCLYGLNHGVPADDVAQAVGITAEQVGRVWDDITAKRKATRYLHAAPRLVEGVAEIG